MGSGQKKDPPKPPETFAPIREMDMDDVTGQILLDPFKSPKEELDPLDTLGEFDGEGANPGTAVVSLVAEDVQRAIEVGVSVATTMIEPLPTNLVASMEMDDGSLPFIIRKSVTVIGRSKEVADIVISAESQVSRHHAAIIFAKGEFCLEDLESTNGTYVGERRIKRVKLKPGDTIRIGKHTMRLRLRHK